MVVRVSSPTLVGRAHELERVASALSAARTGQPAFILLAGEAGVGKTRLLREIAARARATRGQVLEGGCVQVGTEGLPFGPLIEALRGLSYVVPATELDELLGSGRAELARLMPHLQRETDGSLEILPPDSSAQGRLFEHVLLLFERLAGRAPLLVIIEDVHWADRSTLELLGFLGRNLRRGPIVLVVSYRSDELHRRHPLLPFLAEQERGGRAERLELRRFDRSELAAQLAAILGAQPEPELVARIMARSEGNPFYAEELLAAGTPTGRLPDTLREVLLARLAALSEPTQELLRLASAGGMRIAPVLLASVLAAEERDLDAPLGEAVSRHILVPLEGAAEARYAFRHALVQEAVYGELLPGERSRLHAFFAQALADRPQAGADASRAAEIAYHWQAANDLPRAFDAWIGAGIAAEAIYASAEAREDFEHALELWDRVPDAAARAPIDRIELLTRAAFHAEGPATARSVAYIRTAIALVDPTTDPTRAGLLYERLGQYASNVLDVATTTAAFEEAVRLVPSEPPSAARSWVLSGLGRIYAEADRQAEAVVLCEEALTVARAAGAPEVESRALVPLGTSLVLLGDVETGLATIRRGRDLAVALGDVHEVAGASVWLTGTLCMAGLGDEAIVVGLDAETYAVRHGLAARWVPGVLFWTTYALLDRGRLDEAAAAIDRVQQYELTGPQEMLVETQLVTLDVQRGEFDAARVRAERIQHEAKGSPLSNLNLGIALAQLALWNGEPLAAQAAVTRSLALLDAHPTAYPDTPGWVFAMGIRAEAAVADQARAGLSEADLAETRARGAALVARMQAFFAQVQAERPYFAQRVGASLATCEAEFSRLVGAPDPDRWAAAAAGWEALRIPYEEGYALMREGEATLEQQRDGPGAARALTRAYAIASEIGAVPLRQATEKIAARAGIELEPGRGRTPRSSATPTAPGGPARPHGRHHLTPREREVLALVAAGRSDGEIAEALFISKKTASYHVAMIKGKLGARSRVEIATDALGLGLLETGVPARRP